MDRRLHRALDADDEQCTAGDGPTAAPAPPLPYLPRTVAEVRSLQAALGNARLARALAAGGSAHGQLQRMPFDRFGGLSGLFNWSYSAAEKRLLDQEREVADYAARLEDWLRAVPAVRGLLAEFEMIRTTTLAEDDYDDTSQRLGEILDELQQARADTLAERGRQRPDAGPFGNRMAHDLLNEVQTFLETPREPRVKAVVNVRERLETAQAESPEFAEAVAASIRAYAEEFRAELARHAKVIWVYTVDGLLTIGTFTKHSVLAAGADVKAAGTARLMHASDAGRDHYLDYVTAKSRVEELQAQLEGTTDERQRKQIAENIAYYSGEEKQHLAKAKELKFDPKTLDREQEGGTVMVDFNSGHYHPRQAYKATHEAWEALGYTVVWDPQSTFT